MDNPFLFLLNTKGKTVGFRAFLAVAPRSYLFHQGQPRPRALVRNTYNWLATLLGDGNLIYRQSVASFSKAALMRNRARLQGSSPCTCVSPYVYTADCNACCADGKCVTCSPQNSAIFC